MIFKDSPIIYSKIEINRIDDGLLNLNCVELVSAWTWNFEKISKIWFQNFKKFLSVELGQITLKIKKYKIIIKGTSLRRMFLDEIFDDSSQKFLLLHPKIWLIMEFWLSLKFKWVVQLGLHMLSLRNPIWKTNWTVLRVPYFQRKHQDINSNLIHVIFRVTDDEIWKISNVEKGLLIGQFW